MENASYHYYYIFNIILLIVVQMPKSRSTPFIGLPKKCSRFIVFQVQFLKVFFLFVNCFKILRCSSNTLGHFVKITRPHTHTYMNTETHTHEDKNTHSQSCAQVSSVRNELNLSFFELEFKICDKKNKRKNKLNSKINKYCITVQ